LNYDILTNFSEELIVWFTVSLKI